jgi:hypothetical protein
MVWVFRPAYLHGCISFLLLWVVGRGYGQRRPGELIIRSLPEEGGGWRGSVCQAKAYKVAKSPSSRFTATVDRPTYPLSLYDVHQIFGISGPSPSRFTSYCRKGSGNLRWHRKLECCRCARFLRRIAARWTTCLSWRKAPGRRTRP